MFSNIKSKDQVLYGSEVCTVLRVSTLSFRIKSKKYGNLTVYKSDGTIKNHTFLTGPSHAEVLRR